MKDRNVAQPLLAAGALIEKDGRFLLIKEVQLHIPNHPDHGKWNIPAGMVDLGDDPITTVINEVAEEAGMEFKPTHLLGVYNMVRHRFVPVYGHPTQVLRVVLVGDAKPKNTKIHDDVSETKWFSPEEIRSMSEDALRESDIKTMIDEYLSGIRYPLGLLHHNVQKNDGTK